MKRIFLTIIMLTIWAKPLLVSASHPAHPSVLERSWTVALRERMQSLSVDERKTLKQSLRSEWKEFKKQKKAGEEPDLDRLLLTLIAIILPPLAVYLHQGEINSKFWISLLLTLLIWVPGVVYALLVIFGVVN